MCIVTYLPLSEGSFILTSSREEIPSRVSEPPSLHKSSAVEMLYPKDTVSGGTWIIASNNAKAACLLNGAFESYKKEPAYKHSRGFIPIKYLQHKSFLNFYFQYDLNGIEPFTLVAFEDKALFQLKWDGKKAHVKNLVHRIPHIWSSVTLYDKEVITEREKRFQDWCKGNSFEVEKILSFHKEEERLGNSKAKEEVHTLSITTIHYKEDGVNMMYHDNKTKEKTAEELKF